MSPTELLSREILRLVRVTQRSAFISPGRLSAFYHISEKCVRQELVKLAQENRIRLRSSQSPEEFVAQAQEGMCVRVDLPDEAVR
jgi:hypothetical protein